jgi:hypothetical protein
MVGGGNEKKLGGWSGKSTIGEISGRENSSLGNEKLMGGGSEQEEYNRRIWWKERLIIVL